MNSKSTMAVCRLVLVIFAVLPVVTGCSDLRKDEAQTELEKRLKDDRVQMRLPTGRVGIECAFDPTKDLVVVVAQRAGIATVEAADPGFWKVSLRPSSEDEQRTIHCSHFSDNVTLATKSLVDVTSIRRLTEESAEAEFKWKWALTDDGRKVLKAASAEEFKELESYLVYPAALEPDLEDGLAKLEQNAQIRTEKRTFKKADNGWSISVDIRSARDILEDSLVSERSLLIEIGRVGMNCMAFGHEGLSSQNPEEDPSTIVAKKAGLLTVTPDGRGYWRVALTEKGRSALRRSELNALKSWGGMNGCDYQFANFPMAHPVVLGIEEVAGDVRAPQITYRVRWIPTELGLELSSDGTIYRQLPAGQLKQLREVYTHDGRMPPMPIPLPTKDSEGIKASITLEKTKFGDWY